MATSVNCTKEKRLAIQNALLAACGKLSEIERVLSVVGRNLDDFVSRSSTRDESIVALVDHACRTGWIREFLLALRDSNLGGAPAVGKLFETYPDLLREKAPAQSRKSRLRRAKKVGDPIARNNLVAQYRDLSEYPAPDLAPYARMFRFLIDSCPEGTLNDDLFRNLADVVVKSASPYPLRIDGAPGTGKSSFLSLLYIALERVTAEQHIAPPLYLDLSHYDALADGTKVLSEDLKATRKYLAQFPESGVILLLDGIDDYVPINPSNESLVVAFIAKTPEIKKVVGIGLTKSYSRERPIFESPLSDGNQAELTVVLHAIPVANSVYDNFLASFFSIQPLGNADVQHKLSRTVAAFHVDDVDFLTTTLLARKLRGPEAQRFEQLTDLYLQHCREVLGNDDLSAAADLAFRFTLEGYDPPASELRSNKAWKLVHWHPTVRDFLVAVHINNMLSRLAAGDTSILSRLDYVYPHEISRFSKELVNRNDGSQRAFLKAAESGLIAAGPNARSHMAYLAGRLTSFQARERATLLLGNWKRSIADEIWRKPDASSEELLLARTIYISLAYLGDDGASDEYIERLVNNRQWDNLNRGFHLEYYGDLSYESLTHGDAEDSNWSKTFSYLFQKLSSGRRYKLFDIDLFTLFSLAQHRHENGFLDDQHRLELIKLAELVLSGNNIRSVLLRQYVQMICKHMEKPRFQIGTVARLLYELKSQERKGWSKGKTLNVRESVADHTYGAVLLGMLYLPPSKPDWPAYDKRAVLRMVFAHDIAEAITGDIINKTDKQDEVERDTYAYIGLLGTYNDVEGARDLYQSFLEFDQRATLNSQIANDLDKLDNLMQLYIVKDRFSDAIAFSDWKLDLIRAIKTEAGKQILSIITNYFDQE